jgi:hypothetical protein
MVGHVGFVFFPKIRSNLRTFGRKNLSQEIFVYMHAYVDKCIFINHKSSVKNIMREF